METARAETARTGNARSARLSQLKKAAVLNSAILMYYELRRVRPAALTLEMEWRTPTADSAT